MHDSNSQALGPVPLPHPGLLRVLKRERWAAILIAFAAHLIAFTVVINTVDMWALVKLELEEEQATIDIGLAEQAETSEQSSSQGEDANDDQAASNATSVAETEQLPFTPPRTNPESAGKVHLSTNLDSDTSDQLREGVSGVTTLGDGRGSAGDNAYGNRGEDRRRDALNANGGSERTENAMEKGLAWLASAQLLQVRDPVVYGAWDARYLNGADLSNVERADLPVEDLEVLGGSFEQLGLTALVTLAFTGAGYTRTDGVYAKNVRAAVDYLLRSQQDDGYFASPRRKRVKPGNTYDHAISLLALADLYALTGERDLHKPVELGLEFLLSAQQANGSWDYAAYDLPKIAMQQRFDMSITGFATMALMSCKSAGFEIPEKAMERIVTLIRDHATSEDGEGIYSDKRVGAGRRNRPMTAVNNFLRQLLGQPASHHVPFAQRHMLVDENALPNFDARNGSDNNPYGWYYSSLALMLSGDESTWKPYNVAMKKELLDTQISNEGPREGSWAPVVSAQVRDGRLVNERTVEWADAGGRIYVTALSCLCLQVYYRYIPEFLKAEGDDYAAMW